MSNPDRQVAYWDRVAEEKVFSHPFHFDRILPLLPRRPRILDYGCGYGRTVGELVHAGFEDVVGVDPSRRMIEIGRRRDPRLDLRCVQTGRLPFEDAAFDLVVLFAVLTCVVSDRGHRAMLDEIERVLRPGGILYLSDYPLQADARNVGRYERWSERYGVYGTFELTDGAVVRHFEMAYLRELLSAFGEVSLHFEDVATMNGNQARIVQFVGRKTHREEAARV